MRGRVSDWVLFPQRVSPLRRRVSFWMPRKKPKRHQGAAQDERFALIFAHPTPSVATRHLPLTGGVGPGPHFYGGRQLGKLGGYRKGAGGQGIGFCSITAAAEFPATFGRCSYWLEARLCVGRAQVRLSGWHILGRLLISVGAAHWAARGFQVSQRSLQPRRGDPRGRPYVCGTGRPGRHPAEQNPLERAGLGPSPTADIETVSFFS